MRKLLFFTFVLFSLFSNLLVVSAQTASVPQDFGNGAINSEISLPQDLKGLLNICFGYPEDHILTLRTTIMLCAMFIVCFILMQQVFMVISIIGTDWKTWAGAFLITAIASVAGAFSLALSQIYGFAEGFAFLKDKGILTLGLLVLVLILVVLLLRKLLGKISHADRIAQARMAGEKLAARA